MLKFIGYDSLDSFSKANVPKSIQISKPIAIGKERFENCPH